MMKKKIQIWVMAATLVCGAVVGVVACDLTSSLVRYFYLPHDGTYGFKGGSEDLTGDAG